MANKHSTESKQFEKFLSYEIIVLDNSQSQMFLFYNNLWETGKHYGIYLKPQQKLHKNHMIYEEGFFTTPYHIKELTRSTPEVLTSVDKRLQLLILSHAETYNGCVLIIQRIMPYVPALRKG